MDVKPDFKQIELRQAPPDWNRPTFGNLYAEPSRNGIYKSSAYQGRGTRIVNMGEMFGLEFISDQEMSRIELTTREISINGLQDGDLLFGRRSVVPSGAGKCSLVVSPSDPLTFESSIIRVRLDKSEAHPKFYYYFFASPAGRSVVGNIISGTNIKGIRATELRGLEVPHPPKAEQEAIAEALSDADALIESLEQLLDKKRHIKQGAMQELLTGRRRLPGFETKAGFKQTEVGMIQEDWGVTKLGKHATFKTGPFGSALHQSDYVDGGVPVINPMQIVDGRIQPTSSMAVTEEAARKLSDFRLSSGDIVIGRRGDMGRCAFVQPDEQGWLCGTGSMIIRAGPSLDGRFIQRVLSSPPIVAAIENASVGSTMVNLNQSALGNLLVVLPSTKAEQEAIASILSDIDTEIAALDAKLNKAHQLKQGMMQELLTGRIRLV